MIDRLLRLLSFVLLFTLAPAAHAARCDLGVGTNPITVGSGNVLVHLPGGAVTRPLPLVLLLHGSGGSGRTTLDESRLTATADRHGFLVAAPDAAIAHDGGFVWNIPGVPTIAGTVPGPEARDDVAFLGAVIDRLVASGCADRTRVYATGISGGGRMTSWLGCVAAERLAAIAPVVGLRAGRPLAGDRTRPDPDTCRPKRALAVLAFAGGADTTNPVAGGGAGYWQYPMAAAEARWAALDRCSGAPTTRWIAPGTYEQRYGECADGTEVTARISVAEGHHWLADNDAMWAFFTRFRRAR